MVARHQRSRYERLFIPLICHFSSLFRRVLPLQSLGRESFDRVVICGVTLKDLYPDYNFGFYQVNTK